VEKPRHPEKENIKKIDNLPKNQILNNFDFIDNSLENLLLNLSYNINQELFKANLIKKMYLKIHLRKIRGYPKEEKIQLGAVWSSQKYI